MASPGLSGIPLPFNYKDLLTFCRIYIGIYSKKWAIRDENNKLLKRDVKLFLHLRTQHTKYE